MNFRYFICIIVMLGVVVFIVGCGELVLLGVVSILLSVFVVEVVVCLVIFYVEFIGLLIVVEQVELWLCVVGYIQDVMVLEGCLVEKGQ